LLLSRLNAFPRPRTRLSSTVFARKRCSIRFESKNWPAHSFHPRLMSLPESTCIAWTMLTGCRDFLGVKMNSDFAYKRTPTTAISTRPWPSGIHTATYGYPLSRHHPSLPSPRHGTLTTAPSTRKCARVPSTRPKSAPLRSQPPLSLCPASVDPRSHHSIRLAGMMVAENAQWRTSSSRISRAIRFALGFSLAWLVHLSICPPSLGGRDLYRY